MCIVGAQLAMKWQAEYLSLHSSRDDFMQQCNDFAFLEAFLRG